MTHILAKLVIGMVAAILMAAISTSTGSAFAQARLGQIARDGLCADTVRTNSHQAGAAQPCLVHI